MLAAYLSVIASRSWDPPKACLYEMPDQHRLCFSLLLGGAVQLPAKRANVPLHGSDSRRHDYSQSSAKCSTR